MNTSAKVVQFQKKQEAKFICSACGADRGCDCNAPAVAKLAEIAEKNRTASRDRMRQKRQRDQRSVTRNTDEVVDIDDEMPTAAEADESYQGTLFDQACLLLESMAGSTRQRFFAYVKEKYDVVQN